MTLSSKMLLALAMTASTAKADIIEDYLQYPTDGAATHLFLLNPANLQAGKSQAGGILLRHSRVTKLDQSETGGEVIESTVNDDFLAASAIGDLGAGALIGISHQTQFHKVETDLPERNRDPKIETSKIQHSQVKINVELTDMFHAGIAIRYLYRDVALYGDPFLRSGMITRYRTTLVGYGAGLAFKMKDRGGLAYAYFPPLRGKTDVDGEERIVVERGQIVADGHYRVKKQIVVGGSYKRWINELDELADGTTASDDQTEISLFGLDPEQYVLPRQLLMLGGDYELTKQAAVRVAVGQETAEFNFRDLARYNRINVRQDNDHKNEVVKTNRIRASLRFLNQGVQIDGGAGYFTRAHGFPDAMLRGAQYEATGREIFATVSAKM